MKYTMIKVSLCPATIHCLLTIKWKYLKKYYMHTTQDQQNYNLNEPFMDPVTSPQLTVLIMMLCGANHSSHVGF